MHTYKNAGVDKEEGYRSVDLIKAMAQKTHTKNVLNSLGSFGALYELGYYKNPVLVSGTDGVGTKLKIAFQLGIYDSVGIDCVAMCVNDILCHGARPLFFLDYLACGKLDAETSSQIVKGVAYGCELAACSLVGGETAEMPGFYNDGEYDIAGFSVGVVEKEQIIIGDKIKAGDLIIGLASSGIHSNGFSLVRHLIRDLKEEFNGVPIGETLLTPTRIYVQPVLECLKQVPINGIAHITGGGFFENIPRIIPDGLCAEITTTQFEVLPIFRLIESLGVDENEMFATFNMGIGMILVVSPDLSELALNILVGEGEKASIIGKIKSGNSKICLK